MDLLAVIHLYQGVLEDVWVTDDRDLSEEWRGELDRRYGITRDEDGFPLEGNEHEVMVLNSYRFNVSAAGQMNA